MTPRVKDSVREGAAPKLDVLGSVLLGLAVGGLLFSVNRAPSWGWHHPLVATGLLVAPLAGTVTLSGFPAAGAEAVATRVCALIIPPVRRNSRAPRLWWWWEKDRLRLSPMRVRVAWRCLRLGCCPSRPGWP